MTFGECKNRALQLAFNYSLAGTVLPESYNNQADYLAMIPGLVNEAQMDIATSERRIPKTVRLNELEHSPSGVWEVYSLPDDCWQMMLGGLLRLDTRNPTRFAGYMVGLGKKLYLPSAMSTADFLLEYWRYPQTVTDDTPDDTELDNEPETHECIVYYVAYGMLLYDDPYRAQVFKTEYEQRIAKLREEIWLEPQPIINRYNGE
ncbi:MAG: hypothetical protein Q4F31_10080 [Eubacteriales bacterium]|nr:hypothetical protein [Eubacteriales bacterium]